MKPLERAIEAAGSAKTLAEACEVVPMAVTQWRRRGRVPAEHCRAIERATSGQVTRYELRPDVFGPAPESQDAA